MYINNYKETARREYERWIKNTEDNPLIQNQLLDMKENEDEITDSFYCQLTFGTSGMRGIIGPGTNRINEYVVRRATQGLASYLNRKYKEPSVVISYDSRKFSYDFARETAQVLSGNNIKAFLFPHLAPVPLLSYAIRHLGCAMGIMITASHNPKIFNGYKVYNSEGYQIVGKEPGEILEEINNTDFFTGIKKSEEHIEILSSETEESFIRTIGNLSLLKDKTAAEDLSIVYTPLNGTGKTYVSEVLHHAGFKNLFTVPEQMEPDENFTTCPYPNPEKAATFERACRVSDEKGGDLIIGTDPDSDRVGVVVPHKGINVLLTGNQIGILMLDYLCNFRPPEEGQFIMRSIATTPFADRIAEKYGLSVQTTLTGFKYIGEKISCLGREGREKDFYFGFEESTGYLAAPFLRDKDGVSGALIISEAAAWNKSLGRTLLDRLEMLYQEFGYCTDRTENYIFEGIQGKRSMKAIMKYFREEVKEGTVLGDSTIIGKTDYLGETDLPKSDVLEFKTANGTDILLRPSGTEPKMKVYYFETEDAELIRNKVKEIIESFRI